ncbi:MAG: DUF5916 domain-containing protein [Pseudomonadota bacterium]
MRRSFLTCVVLCLSLLSPLGTRASAQPPSTTAVRLPAPPTMDGRILEDAVWADVPIASGFTQTRPNEGEAASQRTEVGIGYTDEALYIGVICLDANPEQIIVADSRRDSPLRETDSFLVVLDSFHDRQNGLVFGTNPAGLEYDAQLIAEGRRGFNVNWDTNWQVRTHVGDYGWSAEFEIPFTSLRYAGGDQQTWGVNFQRNIRRNNEETYWAPLPRQFGLSRVSLAGTVEDLNVPRQRSLKFIPYGLVGAQRGGDLPPGTTDTRETGFDLKYAITPSLVLDATYNTDFAQVEVDDIQVNLNRFSLFFPEKRPFFLENADQFAVGQRREIELFFSRRIGVGEDGARLPIVGGARLSGKIGERTNVGFLQMRSEAVDGIAPQNDFTVARVNQELADRTSIGAIIVNRAGEDRDDYNRSYGLDGRLGIGQSIVISAFAAKTETPGSRGRDHAYRLSIDQDTENWSNSLAYSEVGDAFNPEVGFLRRSAYRRGQFRLFRRIRPDDFFGIQELRPHISYSGFWDLDGFQESGFLHVDNHFEWKSGHEIHTGVNFTFEGVKEAFDLVDGVTVPPGEYHNSELQLVGWNNRGAPVNFELRSFIGGFFNGDRVTLEPTLNLRSSEKFRASLSWNYNDIYLPVDNGDVKINLGRLRMSYSFTPRLTVQALVQYDDRSDTLGTNLRLAWQQSANAGLFLVYNEVDERNALAPVQREIILKYSRIFDLLR